MEFGIHDLLGVGLKEFNEQVANSNNHLLFTILFGVLVVILIKIHGQNIDVLTTNNIFVIQDSLFSSINLRSQLMACVLILKDYNHF